MVKGYKGYRMRLGKVARAGRHSTHQSRRTGYGIETRFKLPTVADIKRVRIVSLYVTMAVSRKAIKPLKTLIYMGV